MGPFVTVRNLTNSRLSLAGLIMLPPVDPLRPVVIHLAGVHESRRSELIGSISACERSKLIEVMASGTSAACEAAAAGQVTKAPEVVPAAPVKPAEVIAIKPGATLEQEAKATVTEAIAKPITVGTPAILGVDLAIPGSDVTVIRGVDTPPRFVADVATSNAPVPDAVAAPATAVAPAPAAEALTTKVGLDLQAALLASAKQRGQV